MTVSHINKNHLLNRRPLDRAEFNALNHKDQLEYLCLLGHLAPSSHNTQPWRFLIHETDPSITLYLDKKFILPASDVDARQATISIGCAAQNIITGAVYYGYEETTEFLIPEDTAIKPELQNNNDLIRILKITLRKSNKISTDTNNIQAIFQRKVVRAEYDPARQISNEVLDIINHLTDGEHTKLHTITDSIRRLSIAEFQSQADAYVINSSKFSRELGNWLLPNDTQGGLGMPGITFGLQDDEASRLHEGLSGKSPLQPEDGLKFAMSGKIFLEKSPLIGIITVKKDDAQHWVLAGRDFEKVFLALTTHGIQLAVHAGITEVSLIKKIFSLTLGTNRYITVLFRAGYIKNTEDAQRPFSPRLDLEDVLLTDVP